MDDSEEFYTEITKRMPGGADDSDYSYYDKDWVDYEKGSFYDEL